MDDNRFTPAQEMLARVKSERKKRNSGGSLLRSGSERQNDGDRDGRNHGRWNQQPRRFSNTGYDEPSDSSISEEDDESDESDSESKIESDADQEQEKKRGYKPDRRESHRGSQDRRTSESSQSRRGSQDRRTSESSQSRRGSQDRRTSENSQSQIIAFRNARREESSRRLANLNSASKKNLQSESLSDSSSASSSSSRNANLNNLQLTDIDLNDSPIRKTDENSATTLNKGPSQDQTLTPGSKSKVKSGWNALKSLLPSNRRGSTSSVESGNGSNQGRISKRFSLNSPKPFQNGIFNTGNEKDEKKKKGNVASILMALASPSKQKGANSSVLTPVSGDGNNESKNQQQSNVSEEYINNNSSNEGMITPNNEEKGRRENGGYLNSMESPSPLREKDSQLTKSPLRSGLIINTTPRTAQKMEGNPIPKPPTPKPAHLQGTPQANDTSTKSKSNTNDNDFNLTKENIDQNYSDEDIESIEEDTVFNFNSNKTMLEKMQEIQRRLKKTTLDESNEEETVAALRQIEAIMPPKSPVGGSHVSRAIEDIEHASGMERPFLGTMLLEAALGSSSDLSNMRSNRVLLEGRFQQYGPTALGLNGWNDRYLVLYAATKEIRIYSKAVQAAWGMVPIHEKGSIELRLLEKIDCPTDAKWKGRRFDLTCKTDTDGAKYPGAEIQPGSEDKFHRTQTYKLRATKGEIRLLWVTLIQAILEYHIKPVTPAIMQTKSGEKVPNGYHTTQQQLNQQLKINNKQESALRILQKNGNASQMPLR